jgi:hypothetical protein
VVQVVEVLVLEQILVQKVDHFFQQVLVIHHQLAHLKEMMVVLQLV